MSSLALELDTMLSRVDPETAKQLVASVREALAQAAGRAVGPTDSLGYPIGYFEATAGSFSDEPLDAPSELPMQARETW